MEMARAATTGKVATAQIVSASRGPSPVRQAPIPTARPKMAMTSNARRRADSFIPCPTTLMALALEFADHLLEQAPHIVRDLCKLAIADSAH